MTNILALMTATSSISEACVLEKVAHGIVVTCGGFTRAEFVRDLGDGKILMLDAKTRVFTEEAAAPGVDVGKLVHVDDRLWQVRTQLANAGCVTLQLVAAHVIGEPGDE